MNSAPDPLARTYELLATHCERWAPASLSESKNAEGESFDPGNELVEHLCRHSEALGAWLARPEREAGESSPFSADPAAFLALRLKRWIGRKNEFVDLDDEALRGLVQKTLRALGELLQKRAGAPEIASGLGGLARAFHRELFSLIDASDLALGTPGFAYRALVSAEYSPELQLRVLGLELDGIGEPILDLGAGEQGRLVDHLRAAGKRAVGVERFAEPRPGLVAADWLETPLVADTFGTIVSHLAFSQHFLFQHLTSGPRLEAHARRYMQILHSLRVGGVFAYAPGLAFIERLLPAERWRVEERAVPELEGAATIRIGSEEPIAPRAVNVTRLV